MMAAQPGSFVITNVIREEVFKVAPIDSFDLLIAIDEDGTQATAVLSPEEAARLCDWLIAWLNSDIEQAVQA